MTTGGRCNSRAYAPCDDCDFLIVGGFYSEVALRKEKKSLAAQCILDTS